MFNIKTKQIAILFFLVVFPFNVLAADDEENSVIETFNRGMFAFNGVLDHFILKPLAKGYRAVTNQYVRDRVAGVIKNIREPINVANHLLQLEFVESMSSLGRFASNTTLGLFGMYDVGENAYGLSRNNTNFDETLSSYCIQDGPYIVLPFLGPGTPRGYAGATVDVYLNPIWYGVENDKNYSAKIAYSYSIILALSVRESSIELIDNMLVNSLDPYSTVRSAYLQNRKQLKGCRFKSSEKQTKNSYDFDFDFDEDED